MKIRLLQWILVPISCHFISPTFAQDKYELVRKELTSWDNVRGSWIADSYESLEKGHAVPDRMFEEDVTPAELFQLAPEVTRRNIQEIISKSPNSPTAVIQTKPATPSTSSDGLRRVTMEDNSANTRTGANRTTPATGNFNGIFRNANCTLVQGRSYGDPHIKTFDGSTFSFQTVGEYILARSSDGQFEVQGRQKPETDKVSLNGAVAMNVAGDQVGIYAQDVPGRNNSPIRVNGQSVYMQGGSYFLPSGGTIQHIGKKYIVTWPTGERVQADMISSSGRSFINLSIYVYDCYGDYYGVLGNANGNRGDDFIANGRNLNGGIAFDPFDNRSFDNRSARAEREQLNFLARDFGGQFLVNDRNTLFEYDFGYSSWSFVDPTFPRVHYVMNDISSSQRERARQECIRQGIAREDLSACIMDLSHANIAPTPRPTAPDRVSGRSTAPVTNPRPNVNRRDAGGGQGVRTPLDSPRSDSQRGPDNADGNTRGRDGNISREGEVRTPIEQNDARTPARTPIEGSTPIRQRGTDREINSVEPTRKPIEDRDNNVRLIENQSARPTTRPTENTNSTVKPNIERRRIEDTPQQGSTTNTTAPNRTLDNNNTLSKPNGNTSTRENSGKTGKARPAETPTARPTSTPSRSPQMSNPSRSSSPSISGGSRSGSAGSNSGGGRGR